MLSRGRSGLSGFLFALVTVVVLAACAPAATPTAAPKAAEPTKPAAAAPTTAPTVAPTIAPTVAPTAAPTTAPTVAPTVAPAPTPSAPAIVKVVADPKFGNILVDEKGMTLYLYTKDEPNVTNCYDQCATNWPPLMAGSAALKGGDGVTGKLDTVTRKDGSKQVTYNGMPLYYWIRDSKAGDTTGQDVGSVWFVVSPTQAGFPTVIVTKDAKLGRIVTDLKNMTLYKFTKDTPNTSTCYDQCATNWPPLLVKSGDPVPQVGMPGKLGTTTRTDGSKQVTLDGVPLYYWAKDAKPGDTTGQGVNSAWYVIEVK